MPRQLASDVSERVLPKKAGGRMRTLKTVWRMDRISLLVAITAISVLLSFAVPLEAQIGGLDLESPILPGASVPAPQYTPVPQHTQPIPTSMPIGSSIDFESAAPNGVAQANFVGCNSCGSIGCHGCDDYGPGYSCPPGVGLWIRADYLVWYERDMDTIPLATTSTGIPATNADDLLDLDAAETSVLFGGRGLSDDPLNGWRLEVGAWLDAGATFGIFGRYFEVEDRSFGFAANSNQFDFLGIPFFNADDASEDALELVVQGERTGAVAIEIEGGLRNWEILFRQLSETGSNYRLDWVYGYRNLRLFEDLRLDASTTNFVPLGNIAQDTSISLNDTFRVKNQFHGVDFGVTGHSHEGCWSLDFLLKVALGVMDQEVTVDGQQFNIIPGTDPAINIGGLFSQETNIGKNDENTFSVIPEFNINLGYAITPNLDFTIGYTFIFVSDVIRAGSAIDRSIDIGLLADLDPVNSSRPQINFDDTSYYIHGLNLGLTARF